jgi:hypothetical protein
MLEVADIVRLHGAAYRKQYGDTLNPARTTARSGTLPLAVRRSLGATFTSAITARRKSSRTTPAAIVPVRSVTRIKPSAG